MSINPEYFFPTLITNITSLNGGLFGVVKATDVYPAVDVTDVSQSPMGTTKPYQIAQLITFILQNYGFVTYFPTMAASTTNLISTYNNGISGVGATLTNANTQLPFAIDGQTGILNDRYLIKNQTSAFENGIYTLTNVGSLTTNWVLTRSVDFNSSSNIIDGGIVYVLYGSINGNTLWQDTFTPSLIVGTTAINYNQWAFNPTTLILYYAGNPNGNIAGQLSQLCWDTVDNILYVCTTAGTASTAVWTPCIGQLTNGQLRIGNTGNPPSASTLSAGTNISIINSAGAIIISATGMAGFTWTHVTGTSQTMASNNGYIADNSGLVTFTLPATSAVGDEIDLIGRGSGGWTIAQGSGQQIIIGNASSTSGTGGSISSTNRRDSLSMICTSANSEWTNLGGVQGNLTIV